MIAIQNSNTAPRRLIRYTIIFKLLFVALLGTGCDTVDSNAPVVEVQATPSFSVSKAEADERWVGPPDAEPLWHDLLGKWKHVGAEKGPKMKVTFKQNKAKQVIKVRMGCVRYKGTFSSVRQGALTISDLQPTPHSCAIIQEDPLVTALRAAGAYKVADGRLYIASGHLDEVLTFVSVGKNSAADDDS